MKISTIIALLAIAAPAIHALPVPADGSGKPDGPAVFTNLGYTADPPVNLQNGRWGGDFEWNPSDWNCTSWEDVFSLDNIQLPNTEDMNNVYDGFCQLCDLASIVNLDQQFCFLCTIDIDGDGDENETAEDLLGFDIPTFCFSELSTVQTPQGSVTMKDLQVGDHVLTGSGDYEPVYAWGHKHATDSAEFLQFNGGLETTAAHLVFVEGKTNPVRADSIQLGDVLQGPTKVESIEKVQRNGVYTPLTPSGTVVVNGITASSYISLQAHAKEYVEFQGGFALMISYQDFIHMALSPFRLLTLGVSSKMGNTYTEEGIPKFVSGAINFAQWADGQNILVQAVLFMVFLLVTGTSMLIENQFGPALAPLAVAGVGAYAYALNKKNGGKISVLN